jgi:hypothetical protein
MGPKKTAKDRSLIHDTEVPYKNRGLLSRSLTERYRFCLTETCNATKKKRFEGHKKTFLKKNR